ncbi:MAG TPA: leucyl aminopeptidase family protein [Acetobacteraceae bacterium]|nr:leucyl aminopeptidase family protein [Acetobacteraceae bacterium]
MLDIDLPCVPSAPSALKLHAVRPGTLESFLALLPSSQAEYLRAGAFTARGGELALLPGGAGIDGAVFGLGDDRSPFPFGDLPFRLPSGVAWELAPGDYDRDAAVLGWCLGAYRFRSFKAPSREPARLSLTDTHPAALAEAEAVWMVRDLINTPANLLGPAELADVALALADRHGARTLRVAGAALAETYPAVAAVGAGSARAPVVAGFDWRGSGADDASPLIALCGKGVCFDTGGYDLKPSSNMLRMKKDMGGAATVLGIARVLMQADLPLRLMVRIGCVENSVSGTAMRPLDVIRTRRGLSVEIGNTDAEGRLVLADLLAEASDAKPALLVDCATLTGAARAALGPDLPAMFASDAGWAARVAAAGEAVHDPVWRLPLWDGYDSWLDSGVADLNNVSTKPFAGAIVAALFLRRFVAPGTPWLHFDVYSWNDATRPGRPEGGEAQVLRALCSTLKSTHVFMKGDRNTPVT